MLFVWEKKRFHCNNRIDKVWTMAICAIQSRDSETDHVPFERYEVQVATDHWKYSSEVNKKMPSYISKRMYIRRFRSSKSLKEWKLYNSLWLWGKEQYQFIGGIDLFLVILPLYFSCHASFVAWNRIKSINKSNIFNFPDRPNRF